MKLTTHKATVLAVVAVLVAAMAGGALAAAPSINTETTNTSSTSDLTDGDTQADNATTSTSLNWSADSANSSVEITQDGRTLFTASPENYSAVDTGSDGNPDLWYYNVSLADAGTDYDGLEAAANENVTLNVTLTNDTEVNDPDTTNISYEFENGEERAFIAGTTDDTEVEADGGTFSLSSVKFWQNDSDAGAARVTDSTTITTDTSTIEIDVQRTDAVDSFGAAADGADGLTLVAFANVNDQTVPVFVGSADAEWLDDDEAYVMLDESGETATVENANALVDSESAEEIDVQLVGNEALGFLETRSMLASYDAGTIEQITAAASAVDVNGNPDYEAVN